MKRRSKRWVFIGIPVIAIAVFFGYDIVVWNYMVYTSRFTWTFESLDGLVVNGKDDFRENKIKGFLLKKPTGKMCYKNEKGVVIGEYQLIAGRKHGREQYWNSKGSPASLRTFDHGVFHGEQKMWWDNGNLMSYEFFCNGKEHGVFTNWYQTGALQYVTPFSNGAENGECFVYTPSGRLIGHSFASNWNTVSGTVIMERSENKEALIGRYSNSVLVEKWYDWEKWK